MTVEVKNGQSLFDVALIYTGMPLNAFEIAFKNGLNVTDDAGGEAVEISIDLPRNENIMSRVNKSIATMA